MFIDIFGAAPQNFSERIKTEYVWEQSAQQGCLIFGDRPLKQPADPSQFTEDDLHAISYDFESPRWVFEDGEPDDFAAIFLLPRGKSLFIAEPHRIRGEVLHRSKILMEKLGENEDVVLRGGAVESEIDRLIQHLESLPDHSLSIQIIAPSPTLAAVIERNPELLARKVNKLFAYGGFAYRDCEEGQFKGQEVYYTTFNLSSNANAGQTLFDFSEKFQVPLYVFASDNLRLPLAPYYDLSYKLNTIQTPSAQYISQEIETWNRVHPNGGGGNAEMRQREAEALGYRKEDAVRFQMTPADAIAVVVDLAFHQLEVVSRGFSNIQITDEPRYKENGEAMYHRAVTLEENPDSPIRYVDGFYLKDTNLGTSETFEVLLNHLNNIRWHEQLQAPVASTKLAPDIREFFRLRDLLEETVAVEAMKGEFNYEKRNALFESLNLLQKALNGDLEEIREGSGRYAQLSSSQRDELYAFASEGRGAESVRIFSKVPIALPYDEINYGGKIMEIANDPSQLLDERLALHQALFATAEQALIKASAQIGNILHENEKTQIFTRGMIGSGKSTLLESQLGISEAALFSSDAVKPLLGGNLSHHESVAFSRSLSSLDLPHKIDVKTNIRTRDNPAICHPQDGRTNIILDIAIRKDVVEKRLAERHLKGGKKFSPEEIEEGYQDSMKNRIPIIEAALQNDRIEWHLYDNNGDRMAEIANIANQEIHIIDPDRLNVMLEADPALRILLSKEEIIARFAR